jgi:hypothetical protein
MWALLLVFHPISKFYSLDVDSRKLLVERDFLKKELDWKKYETTIALIQEHLITKTERLLDGWESKLEERDTFMHSLPYNADNFELLDKMLANTAKMWDSYLATKKKAAVEQETSIHGDTELSLSEKGLI